jgi:hypothetical protein
MKLSNFLGVPLLLLILGQQAVFAQQWYEPSLKTNNLKADTCSNSETLVQLLTYYERLAESEPQLWVSYYYQSYINFKLSNITGNKEQKNKYLQKAFNIARFCQNRFPSNIEVNALFGAVSASCIRWGVFENAPQKWAAIGQVIDTSNCNPRMCIARTIFLLSDPVPDYERLADIKPILIGFYADSNSFNLSGAYTPSWGQIEIEQLLTEF